jgi:hypothetical protein
MKYAQYITPDQTHSRSKFSSIGRWEHLICEWRQGGVKILVSLEMIPWISIFYFTVIEELVERRRLINPEILYILRSAQMLGGDIYL